MLPNGVRLSCGAELERSQTEDYLRKRGAVSFRRVLGGGLRYPTFSGPRQAASAPQFAKRPAVDPAIMEARFDQAGSRATARATHSRTWLDSPILERQHWPAPT